MLSKYHFDSFPKWELCEKPLENRKTHVFSAPTAVGARPGARETRINTAMELNAITDLFICSLLCPVRVNHHLLLLSLLFLRAGRITAKN
jgi:hypothetical protein